MFGIVRGGGETLKSIVILGDYDHGKSTLLGRLLFDNKQITKVDLDKYHDEASRADLPSFYLAWAVDKSKLERERGVTMEVHAVQIRMDDGTRTFFDTPGHPDFMKTTIRGCSQAKTAIYVISASQEQFKHGLSQWGAVKQQLIVARAMGVERVIVAINKMDTVGYDQGRFKEIQEQMTAVLTKVGFPERRQTFVPIAALTGDNVVVPCPDMPWQPTTLIAGFDKSPLDEPKGPFRLSVLKCHPVKIGMGGGFTALGTVLQGTTEDGAKLQGQDWAGWLQGIEHDYMACDTARAGQYVSLKLTEKAERGDVISSSLFDQVVPVVSFIAKVTLLAHPKKIRAGYTPVIHVHCDYFACRFETLLEKITGGAREENPESVEAGDTFFVRCVPTVPNCCVEAFETCRSLGRFVVIDLHTVIGVGIVDSTEPAF